MKFVLAAQLCLILFSISFAQSSETEPAQNAVDKITLAREDADGTITENPDRVTVDNVPLHFYVDLKEQVPVEVTLVMVAVNVKGVRPNSPQIRVRYKTKAGENTVGFQVRPDKKWVVGSYRADLYLEGTRADSLEFEIVDK